MSDFMNNSSLLRPVEPHFKKVVKGDKSTFLAQKKLAMPDGVVIVATRKFNFFHHLFLHFK